MEKLYEYVMRQAYAQGAVSPMIGEASGDFCVVDTDNGDVYWIEIKADKNNDNYQSE